MIHCVVTLVFIKSENKTYQIARTVKVNDKIN